MSKRQSITSSERSSAALLWAAVGVFILVLLGLLFFAGQSATSPPADQPDTQQVTTRPIALQSSFEAPVTIIGLLESPRQASIGFERDGRISTVQVEEGETVRAGQVLAVLDLKRLEAQKAELTASLARAKAQANLAALTSKRLKGLVAGSVESQQRLDEAQANEEAADAQVAEVNAALQSLAVEQDKSSLTAPFEGVVGARLVDEGSVVAAGTPVFVLTDNVKLQARLAMPKALARGYQKGSELTLKATDSNVQATIEGVLPARNRQTRTVDMLVSLDNQAAGLLPGDMVSAVLVQQRNVQGAWVPVNALTNGVRGLWSVFVVNDENRLESRAVQVVFTDGDKAFVQGAINNGEAMVTGGAHRLVPGQLVAISPSDAEAR